MYLEIFTKSYADTENFVFQHRYFIDSVETGVKTFGFIPDANLSDCGAYKQVLATPEYLDLFVKAYNVGLAINHIKESDSRFGVNKKHSNLTDFQRLKKNIPKSWIEYESGEKRYAVIYTDCEQTYKNIKLWCDVPNHYLMRFYNRLLQLLQAHYIKLSIEENINL
jgi:hypothetical protein